MVDKRIIPVVLILVILAAGILTVSPLEEVPNTRGYVFYTTKGASFQSINAGEYFVIKFKIPDNATINVLTEAYVYVQSHTWTTDYVAFSKTLTTVESQWTSATASWARKGYLDWVKCMDNAVSRTTDAPLRCLPGETWYFIIKCVGSSWFYLNSSSPPNATTAYKYSNGAWTEVGDCALRVGGYTDELFWSDFSYTPEHPTVNQTVTFTDTSNLKLEESRQWLVNNVFVTSNKVMSYTFTEPKTYSVTLVTVSYAGSNLQQNKLVDVRESSYTPPEQKVIPWWLVLGLLLSGLASVLVYYKYKKEGDDKKTKYDKKGNKELKVAWRYLVYIIFICFLAYFIYIFLL